jgi:cyclophilin family peptidyl-prolyl cis-trans isomerase
MIIMKCRILPCLAAAASLLSFAASAANPVVEMKTSLGDIQIELAQDKAPITVSNFLAYVEKKHFDGTVFHRVIKGFMNQGGGFARQGNELVQKESMPPIKNEAKASGLRNEPGTIAMARTANPDSASSQFFINVKNPNTPDGSNSFLDFDKAADRVGYTVFGRVIKGMDVVDKINGVATGRQTLKARTPAGELVSMPAQDVPTTDVVIQSVRVVTASGDGASKPAAN